MCMFGGGGGGGGGQMMAPPTPQMPPDPPSYVDPNVRSARERARQTAMARRGFASTNNTSPMGVPNLAATSQVVLGA
jgi:hypothetical protein